LIPLQRISFSNRKRAHPDFKVVFDFSQQIMVACKLSPITFTASCGLSLSAKVLIGIMVSRDSFR